MHRCVKAALHACCSFCAKYSFTRFPLHAAHFSSLHIMRPEMPQIILCDPTPRSSPPIYTIAQYTAHHFHHNTFHCSGLNILNKLGKSHKSRTAVYSLHDYQLHLQGTCVWTLLMHNILKTVDWTATQCMLIILIRPFHNSTAKHWEKLTGAHRSVFLTTEMHNWQLQCSRHTRAQLEKSPTSTSTFILFSTVFFSFDTFDILYFWHFPHIPQFWHILEYGCLLAIWTLLALLTLFAWQVILWKIQMYFEVKEERQQGMKTMNQTNINIRSHRRSFIL